MTFEREALGVGVPRASEGTGRLQPHLSVREGPSTGTQRGAAPDERGHDLHGEDAAGCRDPHETVRVQVVAEQHRLVGARRDEQARTPVVDEVGLVDGLEPDGERLGCGE